MNKPCDKARGHARRLVAASLAAASVLLASSCATPRKSEYREQSAYRSGASGISSLMEELRADIEDRIDIVSEKISGMKLVNKTVYLSTPDSAGKQYPTKVSETSAGREDKERLEAESTYTTDIRMLRARMDSISGKVDFLVGRAGKEASLSWWDMHKDKAYAVAIVALFALVITMKTKKGG